MIFYKVYLTGEAAKTSQYLSFWKLILEALEELWTLADREAIPGN